eukprot:2606565-Prymnesium_polylepis.1
MPSGARCTCLPGKSVASASSSAPAAPQAWSAPTAAELTPAMESWMPRHYGCGGAGANRPRL